MVRGAAPNNLDIALSQLMARHIVKMDTEGLSKMMPTVNSNNVGQASFESISTDNTVDESLISLADRISDSPVIKLGPHTKI